MSDEHARVTLSRPPAMAGILTGFAEVADEADPACGLALVRCTEGRTYVGQIMRVDRDGRTFAMMPVTRGGEFADYPLHILTETVLMVRFADMSDTEEIQP